MDDSYGWREDGLMVDFAPLEWLQTLADATRVRLLLMLEFSYRQEQTFAWDSGCLTFTFLSFHDDFTVVLKLTFTGVVSGQLRTNTALCTVCVKLQALA